MQRFSYSSHIVASIILTIVVSSLAAVPAQEQAKPQAPEAEIKAASAISSAPDLAAKLTQAEAFVKKYPKSTLRPQIVQGLTAEITRVTDAGQRLTLGERFLKTFSNDAESGYMKALVVNEYVNAKRVDEAFTLGAVTLAKQPENLGVLSTLALAGTEEARKQNPKYVTQAWQYGVKAIEMIESNKKPADMDDTYWKYQQALLPKLYLSMGALGLAGGKPAEAKPRLEKAIQLSPTEPTAYVFLGGLIDDEYRIVAESYKTMTEGPEKQATLKKATELMDKVIDLYARGLGAAAGKPEYKVLYDQVLESITPYYRYRYKSTTGLQPLIDKYKTPAQP
jgi:tetratricopeptide (TPR) repeat protein